MLISAVIKLKAHGTGQIHSSTGRDVHGFWFKQWGDVNQIINRDLETEPNSKIDRDIGNDLHKHPAFTLSPLMGLTRKEGKVTVRLGNLAWIRVVTLTQETSDLLLKYWLVELPKLITISGVEWEVVQTFTDCTIHPWAGQNTQRQLIERHYSVYEQNPRWNLDFLTPTSYTMNENYDFPFPLTSILVKGWINKWDGFSDIDFPFPIKDEYDEELVRNCLMISSYRLKTIRIKETNYQKTGCVGSMSMDGKKLPLTWQKAINLLANYAFYCGSGQKTTQGMGMTKLAN